MTLAGPIQSGDLVLLGFSSKQRLPNFPDVPTLAETLLVAHAAPGSKTERLCAELAALGKRIYTLDLPENAHLMQHGVVGKSPRSLVAAVLQKE